MMAIGSRWAARTYSALFFGLAGGIPGVVVVHRMGSGGDGIDWQQVYDKAPFLVIAPVLISAISGALWGVRIVAARTAWLAATLGVLAGVTAVLCWAGAIAIYFRWIKAGVAVVAVGGGWAIPALGALAGLASRTVDNRGEA